MKDNEKITYLCNTIDVLRNDYEKLLNDYKQLKKEYEDYRLDSFKKLSEAKTILSNNMHKFKDNSSWDRRVYEWVTYQ